MADFVDQIGGTQWAQVQSQYFETDAAGHQRYINESGNLLAGIWVDDTNPGDLSKTLASNPAGPTNTYTDLAAEATRAAAHFGLSGAALQDANFIIAQPPKFSDPNALSTGYCAFHDYTEPASPGNSYYKDPSVGRDIAYTNMPYVAAITTGGQNDCGANSVNPPPKGNLDDFSIALGHEIQETVTDPGAEDIIGNITTGSETYLGGWYDMLDANENGDKCAYVGTPLTQVLGLNVSGLPNDPDPGRGRQHHRHRRWHVRGAVAVEQRRRGWGRLLRRRGQHRPPRHARGRAALRPGDAGRPRQAGPDQRRREPSERTRAHHRRTHRAHPRV